MSMERAEKCSFNPFDVTKVWSHADYPLLEVGHLVLSRNPEVVNYLSIRTSYLNLTLLALSCALLCVPTTTLIVVSY